MADFPCSEFEELASFAGVAFEKNAQFQLSEFHGEARFSLAAFKGKTDFSSAVFKDFVTFSAEHGSGGFGSGAECDFRDARFQAPRKVSFHGLTLRPYWFLKVDPREFEFVDVDWIENLKHAFITKEVDELKTRERESKHAKS